jgi:predicted amidophosphoribosyltransferase
MLDDLVASVFPGACPCGARGEPLCGPCRTTLRAAPDAPPPAGIEWWVAPFAYEGVARELVARAKYRNARAAIPWLADAIVDLCRARCALDVVTWVPASRARRRSQGVDHGAVLGRAVARRLGVPSHRLLVRAAGAPQTGASLAVRRRGPDVRAIRAIAAQTVLVVDDVATTGASLTAAARVLRGAGVQRVVAATATRTPRLGRP